MSIILWCGNTNIFGTIFDTIDGQDGQRGNEGQEDQGTEVVVAKRNPILYLSDYELHVL